MNELIEKIRQSEIQKVKVAVTDIDGVLRGKYIHKDKFLSAVEQGFGFCNVIFGWDCNDACYDNVSYTGWHTGFPDVKAVLDLSSYRLIPWDQQIPFFLADFVDKEEKPLELCPRQLLKRVIRKAEALGFYPCFSLEFEFFNFKETPDTLAEKKFHNLKELSPGMFGYSLLRSSLNRSYFNAIMDELTEFGVPLEGLHTETGPGVLEAAILYSGALEAADRAVLFKAGVKEIAQRFGIIPSFMAKWNSKLAGSGGHIHQSLWDLEKRNNLFFDEKDPQKMSRFFRNYLAGQMKCLPEILPLFAPTINSYKRFVEGVWAPTKVNWGIENRTATFRVIPGNEKSTRLETRAAGADLNPYLGIAAALASGLYGIEKGVSLDEGTGDDLRKAYRLPKNLLTATERFENSSLAIELFGEVFVNHFANTRKWEWRQFETAVTSWELERYFEII